MLTVWWIITPVTGPQAPVWLRLRERQPGCSTTVTPSARSAATSRSAERGVAIWCPPDMKKARTEGGRRTGWAGEWSPLCRGYGAGVVSGAGSGSGGGAQVAQSEA